ncbi:MAG: glycerophosphodiester phosphodiesterase family protein [Flavobacteriales bacterium]
MNRSNQEKWIALKACVRAVWLFLSLVLIGQSVGAQTSDLIDFYAKVQAQQVMVAAHRGDWRNYPENSLPAIQSCIEMGVDVVEVDVRRTKDGHFVLMHDETVDRTTNGRGRVGALTLADIRALRLKDKNGRLTDYVVPTLEEVTEITRDRIVVNLDKSADHVDELLNRIDSLDACYQFILKANRQASFFAERFTRTNHFPCIMPILSKTNQAQCIAFLSEAQPRIVELI